MLFCSGEAYVRKSNTKIHLLSQNIGLISSSFMRWHLSKKLLNWKTALPLVTLTYFREWEITGNFKVNIYSKWQLKDQPLEINGIWNPIKLLTVSENKALKNKDSFKGFCLSQTHLTRLTDRSQKGILMFKIAISLYFNMYCSTLDWVLNSQSDFDWVLNSQSDFDWVMYNYHL